MATAFVNGESGAREALKEAARFLVVMKDWTLADMIDVLGEVELLEDEYEKLQQIIERGV